MPHRSSSQCSCPADGQLPRLPEEAARPPPRARNLPCQTTHLWKSIQSQGKAKKKKQNIFCARILLVFENYTSIFEESKTDDLKALYYKHMIIRMEGNK